MFIRWSPNSYQGLQASRVWLLLTAPDPTFVTTRLHVTSQQLQSGSVFLIHPAFSPLWAFMHIMTFAQVTSLQAPPYPPAFLLQASIIPPKAWIPLFLLLEAFPGDPTLQPCSVLLFCALVILHAQGSCYSDHSAWYSWECVSHPLILSFLKADTETDLTLYAQPLAHGGCPVKCWMTEWIHNQSLLAGPLQTVAVEGLVVSSLE